MATLSHTLVTAEEAPRRWMLVLHGLLGRGSNWRTLTRALVAAHPEWGGVLVDLRMHGDSQGFAPPHTVEAVLGHSLGGKVALAWVPRRQGLRHALLLDTNPAPRPEGRGSETTHAVLSVLPGLPARWPSREAFIARVEALGQPPSMARWLAMNLVHEDAGFVFGLELEAMEALFQDVLARDDWAVVESPPTGCRLHFILGGRSTTVQGEDLRRLEALAAAGRLGLTVLAEAGHWVQVDDPAGTLRAVSEALAWRT